MMPVVHGLEAEYGDRIGFVYLDIDDPATAPLKEALGYQQQPEFYLLDAEGSVVEEWSGIVDRETLQTAMDRVLQ